MNLDLELRKKVLAQVLSYISAGVTAVIGALNWFAIREFQRILVVYVGVSPWAWRAIDLFTFMILGILWLCGVYLSQDYYEKGYWKAELLKRLLTITGVQLFVLLVFYYITYIIRLRFGI